MTTENSCTPTNAPDAEVMSNAPSQQTIAMTSQPSALTALLTAQPMTETEQVSKSRARLIDEIAYRSMGLVEALADLAERKLPNGMRMVSDEAIVARLLARAQDFKAMKEAHDLENVPRSTALGGCCE